jgi:hypothetical protein
VQFPPAENALLVTRSGLLKVVVEHVSKEEVTTLANLYDRFAYALDPFSPERDEAERVFTHEIAKLYDFLQVQSVSHHDFRKAVIL